jgi:hypothetical protein
LNRYIGGGRKRDPTTDLRGIGEENGVASKHLTFEILEDSANLPILMLSPPFSRIS